MALTSTAALSGTDDVYVRVVVDMDAQRPGFQPQIVIPAGTTVIYDVAVYILDPLGERTFYSIGYIGGIDRGIAFGHMPGNGHHGLVTGLVVRAAAPLNPGNTAWVEGDPFIIKAFAGPEVQYVEVGADRPALIPSDPQVPIFRLDVLLADAAARDRFDFYVLDFVTVCFGHGGAFSTQGTMNALDSGGDSVPDGTQSLYGPDPDPGQPVPPASFGVDYVDGPPGGGPATIRVAGPGDLNCDGVVDAFDIDPFVLALTDPAAYQAQFPGCDRMNADMNGDGQVNAFDIDPFVVCLTTGNC